MHVYSADLHIHTCLSPCADPEMSPRRIVSQAQRKKLDLIAICDHNASENVAAVQQVAEQVGITVIGGIEICSAEEVHLLGLFADEKALATMQHMVYAHLPGKNNAQRFGDQWVLNTSDEIVAQNDHLLIGATELSIGVLVQHIHELHGLAIASHIDREGFGIIGRLGFIPPDLPLDAVELSVHANRADFADIGFPLITSSDAHFLDDIGQSVTPFVLAAPTFAELQLALSGQAGRMISL